MDNLETIFDDFLSDANDGITLDGINIKFHTLDKTNLKGTYRRSRSRRSCCFRRGGRG